MSFHTCTTVGPCDQRAKQRRPRPTPAGSHGPNPALAPLPSWPLIHGIVGPKSRRAGCVQVNRRGACKIIDKNEAQQRRTLRQSLTFDTTHRSAHRLVVTFVRARPYEVGPAVLAVAAVPLAPTVVVPPYRRQDQRTHYRPQARKQTTEELRLREGASLQT